MQYMARCRNCGAEIPDGKMYCEDCQRQLNTARETEDYLDGLLKAMVSEGNNESGEAAGKKEAGSLVSVSEETTEKPAAKRTRKTSAGKNASAGTETTTEKKTKKTGNENFSYAG